MGPPVLAGSLYLTVPFPVPEAPEVTESCAALLEVAVQAQLGDEEVTLIVPVPPATGIKAEVVSRVK